MKKIIIVILLICSIFCASAQEVKPKSLETSFLYLSFHVVAGNFNLPGLGVGLNYVYRCKYSAGVFYTRIGFRPKNNPNTHRPYKFGGQDPTEIMETLELLVGKVYNLNRAGTIRANLYFGAGLTVYKKAVYGRWDFRANNYPWHYEDRRLITFIINPKIEFPFTRVWGLTFSPMLGISSQGVFYGIGIGHMLGLVRAKKYRYYDEAHQ